MRVALVSPKWNTKANDYPPLGLGYLAAVLEEAGHDIRVFDFGLDENSTLEEEVQRLSRFDPQLVGITAMTIVYHSVLDTAALLKAHLGRPIAVGGPHATLFPERMLREASAIDYVVRGEGEETLLDLVQALESGVGELSGVRGLSYRWRGDCVSNPDRDLIENLDGLPFPARHLFELERYGLRTPGGRPMITILSSRGCPYNCAYCFKGIVGRTYRQRSPGNIMAELRQLVSGYGVRDFYFIDDLFTLDLQRLDALTAGFISEGLDIRWQCLARVDRVNADILRKMYAAGCRRIHYGLESGNCEVLRRIGKGFSLAQARKAIRWTREAGIQAKGYFMLGLPGDTERTMRETADFAASLSLDEAMFSLTTPFPGTRLWDELVRKRPETEYTLDFSRAYYYGHPDEEVVPFLNVSDVSDSALTRWMDRARRIVADCKAQRLYQEAFGKRLGSVLWHVSRIELFRAIARRLLQLGWFGRFAQLRGRMAKTWS